MPTKPTPTQRLDEIEPRLNKIEEALGIAPKSPSFLKRNWLKILPVVALIVSILGWFAGPLYKNHLDAVKQEFNRSVDERLKDTLDAKGGVSEQLRGIKESTDRTAASLDTLKPFIQALITHQFDSASKLSPQALGERLPAITSLLAVAQSQGVRVEPRIAETLRKNLLQVPNNAPGYWPAAAELVSYHHPQEAGQDQTKNCLGRTLPQYPELVPNAPVFFLVLKDCTLVIDDLKSFNADPAIQRFVAEMPAHPSASSVELRLYRVHVVYRGGNLIPVTTFIFSDCTFEFVLPTTPSDSGQKLIRELLAANPTNPVKVMVAG